MYRRTKKNTAANQNMRIQYIMCSAIVALGISMSAAACGRQEPSVEQSTGAIAEGSADHMKDGTEKSSAATEDKTDVPTAGENAGEEASATEEDAGEDAPTAEENAREGQSASENGGESMPIYMSISEEVQTHLGEKLLDTELVKAIEENIVLSHDTEIEACEWVDEEKSCLHIWVQYKEKPEDNYQHKEDYFFFREGEEIQVLYVDYPTKDWHNTSEDRYVWDACDFTAHLEDVTFDGKDDLIIFLGYAGSHADTMYGAYVYEDGFYHYNSSFECIPNYMVDTENRFIRGHAVDSAMYAEDYVFIYEDDEFVKVSYHYYRLDYDSCW